MYLVNIQHVDDKPKGTDPNHASEVIETVVAQQLDCDIADVSVSCAKVTGKPKKPIIIVITGANSLELSKYGADKRVVAIKIGISHNLQWGMESFTVALMLV